MSKSDGTILGLHKIEDNGPATKRWNLVIVADGYTAAQMGKFASDADAVRDRLFEESPFDRSAVRGAINVYRLDVSSRDPGADRPLCEEPGGTGHKAATYFDSTFCSDGKTQRLLYGNAILAMATVEDALPQWHQIIVLVNDEERGGAGGQVAWFSNGGSDWREVAIHEIGHSAFGLADEYDYGGTAHWPGGEPREPNVTAINDPARVKWRGFVTAPAGAPTRKNPTCTLTDPGPSPLPPATIGTFEGARYSFCGAFRPAWDCMMRTTSAPFCAVCTDRIIRVMTPFTR